MNTMAIAASRIVDPNMVSLPSVYYFRNSLAPLVLGYAGSQACIQSLESFEK
jgi:hypothetical protein